MAWEQHGNFRFYVRTRKVNGRVVREYHGGGPAAEQAAAEDALRRALREQQRQAWQQAEEALSVLQAAPALLTGAQDQLTRAALYTVGFHLHARAWRKRHARPS